MFAVAHDFEDTHEEDTADLTDAKGRFIQLIENIIHYQSYMLEGR